MLFHTVANDPPGKHKKTLNSGIEIAYRFDIQAGPKLLIPYGLSKSREYLC
jgi:hypothetical protein